MATTSPDNLRTPDPGDPYNLVADLATLANDVQAALDTKEVNVFRGTASQRVTFTPDAIEGMLWVDTDGIKMIWRKGITNWEPAVWDWSGTTVQMNAFTPPDGFKWYSTSENKSFVRVSGAWQSFGPGLLASGTISAQSTIDIDGLTGASQYEILLDLPTVSADNDLSAQLRSGGSVDTSAVYDRQLLQGSGSVAVATASLAQTSWSPLLGAARSDKTVRVIVHGLNLAQRTMIESFAVGANATAASFVSNSMLRHRTAAAFDGIRFTVSTGTVTGRYEVRAS